jgi:hypothetical protein
MIGVFVGFSRIFLLGILIFKGLATRRLYKSFGFKGLMENYSVEMYNSVSSCPFISIQTAHYDTLFGHCAFCGRKIYIQVRRVILNWFYCLILRKIETIKVMYGQALCVHYTNLQLLLVNYVYLSDMTECYQWRVIRRSSILTN